VREAQIFKTDLPLRGQKNSWGSFSLDVSNLIFFLLFHCRGEFELSPSDGPATGVERPGTGTLAIA